MTARIHIAALLIGIMSLCGPVLDTAADTRDHWLIKPDQYTVRIDAAGFRFAILDENQQPRVAAHSQSGLQLAGHDVTSASLVSATDRQAVFSVTTDNDHRAEVTVSTHRHHLTLRVVPESQDPIDMAVRTSPLAPAYGLGDHGSYRANANLADGGAREVLHNRGGGGHRWISSFVIYPRQRVASAVFTRHLQRYTLDTSQARMTVKQCRHEAIFYYFIGSVTDIYQAYRQARVVNGYPPVRPKPYFFELGFETWDMLRWQTNQQTVHQALKQLTDAGYPVRWAVIGSGFWASGHTTTSFGHWHEEKYPDLPAFRQWLREHRISLLIGLRTNFVIPAEQGMAHTGARNWNMLMEDIVPGPYTQEGVNRAYFLTQHDDRLLMRSSSIFPQVPMYLLDGNTPGASLWYRQLFDRWEVDGIKEDTMVAVPDHTIFNAPMTTLAEAGALVMARNGAYTAPGTLMRVEDTHGARDMGLRTPMNYLQFAASAAPNVYSDTIGFGRMKDRGRVDESIRHAWMMALTAGLSVSEGPWTWPEDNQRTLKKVIDTHFALGPYLYSAAYDSYLTGYPHTMTPLPIAFPDDGQTYDLASRKQGMFQWLIGTSLLAVPHVHEGNNRHIYLPEGMWLDFDTGERYQGPTLITDFDMPLDKTPLFVGGNGMILWRLPDGTLSVRVFPVGCIGDDVAFTHADGRTQTRILRQTDSHVAQDWRVIDANTGLIIEHLIHESNGSISFPIKPGRLYRVEDANAEP